MADLLTEALTGLNVTPSSTGYGIAQSSINAMSPQLVTPYTSPTRAVGIGLGSILLQSLLGYQARQDAARQSIETNTAANTMMSLANAQDRVNYIQGLNDTNMQSRLLPLATALTSQEQVQKAAINLQAAQEVGKLKALGDFYSTPEGQKAREFDLQKIKEEAAARRTPLEDLLAKQAAETTGKLQVVAAQNEGKVAVQAQKDAEAARREQLAIDAKSGNAEADRQLKRELAISQQDFSKAMVQYKADVGVASATAKAKELADLEMQLINEGKDPEVARIEARGQMTQQINAERILAQEESIKRLQQSRTDEINKQAAYRKQLQLDHPNVPAAITTQSAKRISTADTAIGIANDIEKFSNWATYRIGTAFTATDEAQLKSRLLSLNAEERLALTGTASNASERADISSMLNGDFTSSPSTKVAILKRFAQDQKRIAVQNMKGASQSVSDFVRSVEASINNNTPVQFQVPEMGQPNLADLQKQLAEITAQRKQLEAQKGIK